MGDARRIGGIEAVDVDGDIDRSGRQGGQGLGHLAGGEGGDPVAVDLAALGGVDGAHAHLGEPGAEAILEDAGEGRGVGVGVVVEVGIEVGMGVHMQDLRRRQAGPAQALQNRPGDEMIAPQEQARAVAHHGGHAVGDEVQIGPGLGERQVAGIVEHRRVGEVETALGGEVGGAGMQLGAHGGGPLGRPAPVRGVDVGGQAQEGDGGHGEGPLAGRPANQAQGWRQSNRVAEGWREAPGRVPPRVGHGAG